MYAQSAKIKTTKSIWPPLVRALTPSVERKWDVYGEAYQLAKANKHKPWARRWLREHRLGFG